MSRPEDDYPDIEELPEEEWEQDDDAGEYEELLLDEGEDDGYDEDEYLDDEDDYPDEPTRTHQPPASQGRAALLVLAVFGIAIVVAWLQLRSDIVLLQNQVALLASSPPTSSGNQHVHADMDEQLMVMRSLQEQINSLNARVDNFAIATASGLRHSAPDTADPEPVADTPAPPEEKVIPRGDWLINLASFPQRSQADSWVADFSGLDYPLEVVAVQGQQGEFFRVRVSGLESYDAAKELAAELSRQEGLSDPWISRR